VLHGYSLPDHRAPVVGSKDRSPEGRVSQMYFSREGYMTRITTIAAALLVPALLTACEEDEILGFEDCEDLAGNFRTTDFGFRGTTNASLVRDFDREGTAFTLTLRNDDTFESTFTAQGATPLVRTGAFTATPTELRLGNRALFLGAQDNLEQRFSCELVGANRFRVVSAAPARFDFDEDEGFEEGEEGVFEGEFELF
jgi:hypothetical protein